MDKFSLYAGQLLAFKEYFTPKGHKACQGCGVALAVRHVYKALDTKVQNLEQATWQIPWQEAAITESASTLTGLQPAMLSIPKAKPQKGASLNICFDNEAARGKITESALLKRLPAVAAASGYEYIATACPSHPFDLIEKVRRAWDAQGSTLVYILCPCPVGWGFDPQDTVKIGRMAVETRIFPLYEIAGGYYNMTVEQPNPRPLQHYINAQERYAGWKSKKIEAFLQLVTSAFSALKDKTRISA